MKKLLLLILLSQILTACASGLVQLAHENQTNINKLTVGMNKGAVISLMGDKAVKTGDGMVSNPFRSETFQDKAGVQYEILYYVTQKNLPYQPLKLGQTTPLVFKNGQLMGWGEESLRRAKEKVAKEIDININR